MTINKKTLQKRLDNAADECIKKYNAGKRPINGIVYLEIDEVGYLNSLIDRQFKDYEWIDTLQSFYIGKHKNLQKDCEHLRDLFIEQFGGEWDGGNQDNVAISLFRAFLKCHKIIENQDKIFEEVRR